MSDDRSQLMKKLSSINEEIDVINREMNELIAELGSATNPSEVMQEMNDKLEAKKELVKQQENLLAEINDY